MMIHIPDELSSFWLMTISMGLIQCYEIKVMDACDVSWFRQQQQQQHQKVVAPALTASALQMC